MKLTDVKIAINSKLKGLYPDIKIYGKEIHQGYVAPCFFSYLVSQPRTHSNKNFAQGGITVKILYFQEIKDEADQLRKVDEIFELFDKTITIGDRAIEVKEREFDYVGEKNDILEITLKIPFLENNYKEPDVECATSYKANIKEGKNEST